MRDIHIQRAQEWLSAEGISPEKQLEFFHYMTTGRAQNGENKKEKPVTNPK